MLKRVFSSTILEQACLPVADATFFSFEFKCFSWCVCLIKTACSFCIAIFLCPESSSNRFFSLFLVSLICLDTMFRACLSIHKDKWDSLCVCVYMCVCETRWLKGIISQSRIPTWMINFVFHLMYLSSFFSSFLTRRPLPRLGRPIGIWKTGTVLSTPGAGVC